MAINLDCPRCKARLRVPNKKAGGYVKCPHCQGRFWVDKAAASDASPAETVTMAVPPAAPSAQSPNAGSDALKSLGIPLRTSATAVPPRAAISPAAPPEPPSAPTLPPRRSSAPAPAGNSSVPPAAPPVVPRPARKVARFIPAEAAQSTLQLAADGKLPELHLSDGGENPEKEKKSSSMSPWTLAGIVSASLLVSLAILLLGDTSPPDNTEGQKAAWRQIEANYFSDPAGGELKPYNRMLREAKRAQQSQDRKAQRELLGKVRDLLRAERGINEKGLTGSRERDKILERHVTVLLNGLRQE